MTALVDLYRTDHAGLLAYVRSTFGLTTESSPFNTCKQRREEMARRLRLYRDDGRHDFEVVIDQVFEDAKVRLDRKRLIDVACEQNVSRRIVDEVFSLYDRPAVRTLTVDNDRFHAEEKRIGLHELMQEAHRLTGLCNEVLIWAYAGSDGLQRLRVVTPDTFDAISDPRDRTQVAGLLLDMAPMTVLTGAAKARLPHFELWDDTYRYLLDANGRLVDEAGEYAAAPIEHGLGRIPGVLFHRRNPSDQLLDPRHGRDIISAHLGIGLINVMMLRLAKAQGENQPVLSGDLAAVAAGQRLDGENPVALPPGVDLKMLQLQSSPQYYLLLKQDKLTSVAQTYGLSYQQLTFQETSDTSSGKAYQVRREKLTELRNEQRQRALVHEALVISLMGFDVTGLAVDHREQALPQDAVEEVQLLDLKMRLGLDSPRAYLRRKDPDLTDAQIDQIIHANLADFATLIVLVRALNIPATATAANPGQDPTINGSGRIAQTVSSVALDGGSVHSAPSR